jgi:hypothetical protein
LTFEFYLRELKNQITVKINNIRLLPSWKKIQEYREGEYFSRSINFTLLFGLFQPLLVLPGLMAL